MTIKQERAAHLIQDILSTLLRIEVTDPALDGITVTDVKVDREIEYADVYVHALGDDERRDEVMAGLQRANGFLRRELAQRIHFRNTPVLHFHWDVALERGERIDSLLDQIHRQQDDTSSTEEQESDEA
ncbi:MAG TPA: 30S ribosome-binding factor RbfA [Aggregatilinea sp.]|uniref:30S ribosome-binding factor RbfA n=1 Tax=Aggregatilinea sp. TaxID=2806333 RepID=UPI002BC33B75|nr:30S ribosome-binding factor RbfA [Aggregatilinea sp.]HML22837.1 30S ribosome-binding factor RbfA [Aggregatilinea sp.]